MSIVRNFHGQLSLFDSVTKSQTCGLVGLENLCLTSFTKMSAIEIDSLHKVEIGKLRLCSSFLEISLRKLTNYHYKLCLCESLDTTLIMRCSSLGQLSRSSVFNEELWLFPERLARFICRNPTSSWFKKSFFSVSCPTLRCKGCGSTGMDESAPPKSSAERSNNLRTRSVI